MGIFKDFTTAVAIAIKNYEDAKSLKKESISPERAQDIRQLKAYLAKREDEISALGLRILIEKYTNAMSGSWLSNLIPIFDKSDLRKRLNEVLAQFSSQELISKENLEIRNYQNYLGTAADGTNLLKVIDQLNDQIAQAKQK